MVSTGLLAVLSLLPLVTVFLAHDTPATMTFRSFLALAQLYHPRAFALAVPAALPLSMAGSVSSFSSQLECHFLREPLLGCLRPSLR